MKILIVEDNEDSRKLLSKQLRAFGHETKTASNGVEALKQALEEAPDILVSDIQMSEMDGYQLCRRWKQNDKLKDIPVVFYTATYTSPEDEKFALNLGAAAFIKKPTDPDVLVNMLFGIIEKAESGLLSPPAIKTLSQYEYLEEHNKRLVAKLQKKINDLNNEISKRKKAESDVLRIDRMLRTIRECNQLLVRATDEKELLGNICDLVVRSEGFPMAWVGFTENDEEKTVRPVALAGIAGEYLNNLKISWADNEFGRGPAGIAIRTGKTCIARRGMAASDFPRWRASAAKYGFNSSIALPLISNGTDIGSLNIYSKDEDAFNEEQVKLLKELADDLAYGIIVLRKRHELDIATENLARSEMKYSTLVEQSNDGIIIIQDGLIKFANQQIPKMTGFSMEETIGKKLADFVSPKYKEGVIDRYTRRMTGENVTSRYEVDINKKDGNVVPAELNASVIEHEGRAADMAIIRDITERKMAEQALKESEEKYYSIFTQSSEGIYLHDFKGNIIDANEAACIQTEYSREELLQLNVFDLHPDYQNTANKPKHEIIELWKGFQVGQRFRYEGEHRRKDGTVYPTEISTGVIEYANNKYILAIIKDTTERKMAEQAIRQEKDYVKSILDTAPAIIVTFNTEGQVVSINHYMEKLSGYSIDEVKGKDWLTKFILPRERERVREKMAIAFTGVEINAFVIPILTKNGQERLFEWYSTVLRDKDGNITGLLVVGQDITERQKIESALADSEIRYRRLFEAAKDGILIVNAETGLIFDVNPFLVNLLGLTKEDFIGKELWEIGIFNDIVANKSNFKELLQKGRIRYEDLPLRTHDGRQVDVEFISNVYEVNHDKVIQCNIRDITERKKIEQALADEATRRRILLEQSRDGIVILNQEGSVYESNKRFAEMLGYSAEEVLKLHVWDWEYLASNDRLVEMLHNIDEKGDHFETKHRRKDGSIYDVEISTNGAIFAGQKLIFCVCRDITERKEAEAELRESQHLFSTVTNTSPALVWMSGTDKLCYWFNEPWLTFTGRTMDEEMGNGWTDGVHPDDLAGCLKIYVQAFDSRQQFSMEYRLRRHDGEYRWIIDKGTPRFDATGDFMGYIGSCLDITERKKAEEALRKSEEKYRTLFETMAQGVVYQDREGKIISANRAAERILGLTLPQMQRRTSFDPRWHAVHEDGSPFPGDEHPAMVSIKTGKAVGDVVMGIFNIREKGYRWIVINAIPQFRENEKEPYQAYATFNDITQIKQIEKALIQSESKLRESLASWETTFNSMSDAICLLALDGTIVRCNQAMSELTGKPRENIIRQKCYKLVHGSENHMEGCPHLKMIKSGHRESIEFMAGDKWFYTVVDPIFDDKGAITGSVHIMEDVTERKKMEETMIMTDRLASIGELSSGIAHELNNPLTSVIGLTQLLLEGENIPEGISEDLQMVNSEAQRAAKVVKNLLIFARKHPNEMQLSDVNQAIEKVLELREYEQKVSNIRVIRDFAPDLPQIVMDHFQIQQVFLNIVINAEFAMKEAHNEGTLVIKTEMVGEMVRVSFTDDGPGIPGENLKRIFNPFFTTKEVGKGTGLGLSICHGIISQHGGNIYAESVLGKGTTFVVELPINLPEEIEGTDDGEKQ